MKKLFLLAVLAIMLCSCKGQNIHVETNNIGNDTIIVVITETNKKDVLLFETRETLAPGQDFIYEQEYKKKIKYDIYFYSKDNTKEYLILVDVTLPKVKRMGYIFNDIQTIEHICISPEETYITQYY